MVTAVERQGDLLPCASCFHWPLLPYNCPTRQMLALGSQDYVPVLGPQDSAPALDYGGCQIWLCGTHAHRAAAPSKYVSYKIVLEGWEKCTPFPVVSSPDKTTFHVQMFSCDTVSTVGEEAAGRAFSEGDGKY